MQNLVLSHETPIIKKLYDVLTLHSNLFSNFLSSTQIYGLASLPFTPFTPFCLNEIYFFPESQPFRVCCFICGWRTWNSFVVHSITFWGKNAIDICNCIFVFQFQVVCVLFPLPIFFVHLSVIFFLLLLKELFANNFQNDDNLKVMRKN